MAGIRVALAGNPNAGKTTVFNELTGLHQHVGNWPGKTVELKRGWLRHDGVEIEVIDLPGTYSLTAYSIEEVIARDFILNEAPDLVVAVVDASNLERNLYLVIQILELQARLIIGLNMIDRAEKLAYEIDLDLLSAQLGGAEVIPMVATRGKGIAELKDAISRIASSRTAAISARESC